MTDLLQLMLKQNASDLFITVAAPPSLKIDGRVIPVKTAALTPEQSRDMAYSIMNDYQRKEFERTKECNFAISPNEMGRFRVNVFIQQGVVGMVLRTIKTHIPTFDELHLPQTLGELALKNMGLVLFVGGTGTGKTSSQAAMIGYRNKHTKGHIITIEDPIEFVHKHDNCIITQREVGIDTESFEIALQNAMRQAPNVIQIGEIRKRETMDEAIVFSETGHLCMATLHANNSYQALDRIINFFPHDRREQLLMDLSLNLAAIVSQRLIPRKDKTGRVPALEIMLNTPLMADLILRGELQKLHDLIERSTELGMITMDQSLFKLYREGLISYEEALRNAESVNNLRLRIKLESGDDARERMGRSLDGMTF
ncbi:MAG: PilT/PilU family type 4a pilus ATPase [Proteobacteria bacterium]|nr:MAG: PilT/PilU family type 4a pilus ATPase [Pseudomonadota bacterium]